MIKGIFRCVTKIRHFKNLVLFKQSTLASSMPAPQSQSKIQFEPTIPTQKSHPQSISPSLQGQYNNSNISSILSKLHSTSKSLNELPSLMLDKMCRAFMFYDPESVEIKETILEQLEQIAQESNFPVEKVGDIYKWLENIVEFYDKSEVGLLKGDIHGEAFYHMEKWLDKQLKELGDFSKETASMDVVFKKLFNAVTKPHNYRLPREGIKSYMKDSARNIYQRQLVLQEESNEIATRTMHEAYESLLKIGRAQQLDISKKYSIEWFPALTSAIKEEQNTCREKNLKHPRKSYAPYFVKLSPEKIATLALSELMKQILSTINRLEKYRNKEESGGTNFMGTFGEIPSNVIIRCIGSLINCQIMYDKEETEFRKAQKALEKKRGELIESKSKVLGIPVEQIEAQQEYTELQNRKPTSYMKPQVRRAHLEKLRTRIVKNRNSSTNFQHGVDVISKEIQMHMGSVVLMLIKDIIKTKNKYGFSTPLLIERLRKNTSRRSYKSLNVLVLNNDFIEEIIPKIQKHNSLFLHMDRSLPTLIQPAPWVDHQIGGYYLRPTAIMRYSGSKEQQRAARYADMSRVSRVLDILSSVPWRINKRVYDVVKHIWTEGGGKGTIPRRYNNMSNYVYGFMLKSERDYNRLKSQHKRLQQQRDDHSLRCDFRLKLNVAESFAPLEQFYFPHNMDFRGRVYPIPPHLNHMGADLARGLLTFAEGRKLGKTGLKWLKIHTANLIGFDKATLDEKLDAVERNMPKLIQVARDPIANMQWLRHEDCWQALASTIQLIEALNSPNPQEFVSHLHIHQDGSCNGLQHYAALGRDTEGAAQVNLDVLDRPGDIYSHVARMVSSMIEKDSQNPESQFRELAMKLKGHIKRKTVKQTVMTSVYGVTFLGARHQIYRQLRDQGVLTNEKEEFAAAIYVARCTMDSIKNLFNSAHEIKKWLKDCAYLIAKTNNPVAWITPLGLPVIQPYRHPSRSDVVNTLTQSIIMTREPDELPVEKPKQRSAFPPNFVHSLDSTHMMYTCEKCYNEGITFAAVHDSYWTHAASVERMNEILRDEFIRMHEEPLLETLRNSFIRRFPGIDFPLIPLRGDFDLHKVRKSVYFFS